MRNIEIFALDSGSVVVRMSLQGYVSDLGAVGEVWGEEFIPSTSNGPRLCSLLRSDARAFLPHAYIEIESVTVSERNPE